MATNKNATIRYQLLDKCFRNSGRMYFLEDLMEECNAALQEFNPEHKGIGRRQLFDDIRFMESSQGWSVPLEKYRYGKRVYYRYSDLSFSINNQPLNESEAKQISSALMILSRFTGTPQFEWINEIIPVLENKLGLTNIDKQVIAFDENIDLRGRDNIKPLFDAITNQRVLKITYKDFKSTEPYDIIIHPYYLKQYNNRWFAFGLNESVQNKTWNLAIDRIQNIEETEKKYQKCDIDWLNYFYDIVGVTRPDDKEPEEIKLKFTSNQAPYILTKPLHPTQKVYFEGNELIVRISVIPNYELETLILSYAEDVEVISPEGFREKIKKRINAGAKNYT